MGQRYGVRCRVSIQVGIGSGIQNAFVQRHQVHLSREHRFQKFDWRRGNEGRVDRSMSTFPNSPQLLKAGLILLDPDSGVTQRIIALQYNPETLTRKLVVQAVGGESGDRSQALRLKGPPV